MRASFLLISALGLLGCGEDASASGRGPSIASSGSDGADDGDGSPSDAGIAIDGGSPDGSHADGSGPGDGDLDPGTGPGGDGDEANGSPGGDGDGAGPPGEDPAGGGDGDGDTSSGDGDGDGDGDSAPTGPMDAFCFGDGEAAVPEPGGGSGECASPIVIDLRGKPLDTTVYYETPSAPTDGEPLPLGKCGQDTARDIVFNVPVPSEADLEVSVDATVDADPIILVQEGPDDLCTKKSATECVDDEGAGGCEYVRLRTSAGGYDDNTPQVVISEQIPSGKALTVRFRLIDPQGGS